MYRILTAAALVVIGALGGMALRPPPAPSQRTLEVREVQAPAAPGLDGAQLAATIRSVVREEMQRSPLRVAPAATVEKPEEPPRSEPTVEQLDAHQRGQSLIAGAQRIGRWTDEDREQLREVLRQSSAADRDQLLHALIPAINRQEIKVDTLGPPF